MNQTTRAAAAIAYAIVVLLAPAGCTRSPDRPPQSQTVTPRGVPPSGPTRPTAPESVGDDGVAGASSTPASPDARTEAEAFARAWARPDLDAAAWVAGVTPHTHPSYARLLTTVDPANVPARTVTGPPMLVSSNTDVAVFDVPTDGGTLRLTCTALSGRWLVAGVDFTRTTR